MNHLRQIPKLHLSRLLPATWLWLALSLLCSISLSFVSTNAWANNTPSKLSPEQAFLQGQQYVERAELDQAALSLTRIATSSPYAKLLAGNIAAKKADYDRAFLLLLPLQSNQTFSKVAAASLHASLSTAYEKQGDIVNALDQLIRRQAYINTAQAIDDNQQHIWQLLAVQSLESLISMRGESADTSTQGWIDLSLASKNQDMSNSLSVWRNSYADHAATEFANTLIAQTLVTSSTTAITTSQLLPGNIALILPAATGVLAEKTAAFQRGLQSALNQQHLYNEIKLYLRASDPQSAAEQFSLAKNDGAAYIIAPRLIPALAADSTEPVAELDSISVLDNNASVRRSLRQADLTVNDEARQIAAFASSNSMQHILLLAADNTAARNMVKSFVAVWPNGPGATLEIISLDTVFTASEATPDNNTPTLKNSMDLAAKVNTHSHDLLLLAMSADAATRLKPYLDISTPTAAFSSVHARKDGNTNAALNAVRFVDLPFLLMADHASYDYYRDLSADLASYELLRCFALGVDYLQLLIAGSQANANELIINGLSGKLSIDSSGLIQRQLSMAKFTYNAVILENDPKN
jgi:outer membrane PBP1 activator LpoA protein